MLEVDTWGSNDEGTPQGTVVSPLSANIYLNYVLEQRMESWRKCKVRGQVIIVRYSEWPWASCPLASGGTTYSALAPAARHRYVARDILVRTRVVGIFGSPLVDCLVRPVISTSYIMKCRLASPLLSIVCSAVRHGDRFPSRS